MHKTKSQFYQRCMRAIASACTQCQRIKIDKYVPQAFKLYSIERRGKKNKYCAFFYHCLPRFNEIQRQTFFQSTISINFMYLLLFSNSRYSFSWFHVFTLFCCDIVSAAMPQFYLSNLHLCYETLSRSSHQMLCLLLVGFCSFRFFFPPIFVLTILIRLAWIRLIEKLKTE